MITITRLLCVLMLSPLFFLSSEARAGDIVITGGSAPFTYPKFSAGGSFSFVNNAQGFASNGFIEEESYSEDKEFYRAGDTYTPSVTAAYIVRGSTTINGQTYSPVFYRDGNGQTSRFFFTATPFVLPPRDPSQPPNQTVWTSFTTPFTFSGTLIGFPCYNPRVAGRSDSSISTSPSEDEGCSDPVFTTQLSGKGTVTVTLGNYYEPQMGGYVYQGGPVVYNFEPINCFSVGKGDQKFGFCISEDGNIRRFESPQAARHLTNKEGYAMCSVGSAAAFDDGVTSSGWSASVISQPGGADTLPLTITRTTSDGKFELKQAFEWDNKEREVNITMALKNLSGGTVTGVRLSRYFDGNIGNSPNNDRYATTSDSVWAWDDTKGAGGQRGLMLTTLSSGYFHTLAVEKASDWTLINAGAQTARACAPADVATPTEPGDYVGRLTYKLGTFRAGESKAIKMQYKRM